MHNKALGRLIFGIVVEVDAPGAFGGEGVI